MSGAPASLPPARRPPAAGCRSALSSLAPLFAYPDESFSSHLDTAARELPPIDRRAARLFDAFARDIGALDVSTREITYTATFDLAPSCSPYLGIHLFGDENRDRGRLMVGLRSSYGAAAEPLSRELPDHIALVLAFAERFDDAEWADLRTLILEPALAKMEQALADTSNPYKHLVSTARRLARAAAEEGGNG